MSDQVRDAIGIMRCDDDRYFYYGSIVWDGLSADQREALKQFLFQGPVWDGCISSKRARDDLIGYGLAVRVCFMGEQGYTAATYLAYSVFGQGLGIPIRKKSGTLDG